MWLSFPSVWDIPYWKFGFGGVIEKLKLSFMTEL
jgi:hypothetical protein